MKALTTVLMITLFTANAFAAGIFGWIKPDRPGRPGPYEPHRPNITCSATDDGWEEHWGGHGSCRECLAKHGNCVETCKSSFYSCTAEGTDYRGYRMTMQGRGPDRYSSERDAIYQCQYRYNNCRIVSCSETSETVSRRDCR
ncbi:hypothetical protein AZI87_09880 [Bdellovibrio bacteriovorus]|uniref:Secreted protein n=1 Tax=Bdellovibrio bacteriovorus TaxID=959 RepID=A0A162H234_BDEBC|nr:hypothetical protein [Bdellovibrio bacteriovorus]KYG69479.1 hypothetical protein AZI87_09880 [Bdellovibrio bacteriovorus]